MNDLLRPALYDAYHDIQSIKKGRGKRELYTIVGPICETADTFAKNKLLNRLNTHEILFFKNVGAYGASMSSSYISGSTAIDPGIFCFPGYAHINPLLVIV